MSHHNATGKTIAKTNIIFNLQDEKSDYNYTKTESFARGNPNANASDQLSIFPAFLSKNDRNPSSHNHLPAGFKQSTHKSSSIERETTFDEEKFVNSKFEVLQAIGMTDIYDESERRKEPRPITIHGRGISLDALF
jgi:hypothetical protein